MNVFGVLATLVATTCVVASAAASDVILSPDGETDMTFENFVFRDGFGMGLLAQLSENVTLRGGGCYPRSATSSRPTRRTRRTSRTAAASSRSRTAASRA